MKTVTLSNAVSCRIANNVVADFNYAIHPLFRLPQLELGKEYKVTGERYNYLLKSFRDSPQIYFELEGYDIIREYQKKFEEHTETLKKKINFNSQLFNIIEK